VPLADETPQPLGTASAGSALLAARADHVHATLTAFPYASLTGVPASFTPSAHSHTVSDVTGLQTALDGKQAAGTYATLVGGQVPSSMLPSFVDDVIDVGGTLPATGDVGKIYVVSSGANTNKIYRWSGSTFVEISPSPGSTDSVTEGSVNLYHTTARAAAAAPVQSVAGRSGTVVLTKSDVGLGNVTNVDATARANHTGTQTASTISDFATEAAKYGPVVSVAGRTGTVTLAQLASSGTASSTTFLRGDGTWSAAGSTDAGDLVTGTLSAARLPLATTTVAGAVIVGSGLTIASGVLSRVKYDPADAPGAPSAIYISASSLIFSPSPGGVAVEYEVQRAPDGSTAYTTLTKGPFPSGFSVSTISSYKHRVRGFNADGLAGEWGYQEGAPGGSSGGGTANIVEAATAAAFPATGSSGGTLYIATDVSRVYRFDASGVYVELGPE
jgi:hypothetical protein